MWLIFPCTLVVQCIFLEFYCCNLVWPGNTHQWDKVLAMWNSDSSRWNIFRLESWYWAEQLNYKLFEKFQFHWDTERWRQILLWQMLQVYGFLAQFVSVVTCSAVLNHVHSWTNLLLVYLVRTTAIESCPTRFNCLCGFVMSFLMLKTKFWENLLDQDHFQQFFLKFLECIFYLL